MSRKLFKPGRNKIKLFFLSTLENSEKATKIKLSELCKSYVVDTLESYTGYIKNKKENIEIMNNALKNSFSLLYFNFLSQGDFYKLQRLGDAIMFLLGLFPEAITKKVKKDNYLNIGKMSYTAVYKNKNNLLFLEMSHSLEGIVKILNNTRNELKIKEVKDKKYILEISKRIN